MRFQLWAPETPLLGIWGFNPGRVRPWVFYLTCQDSVAYADTVPDESPAPRLEDLCIDSDTPTRDYACQRRLGGPVPHGIVDTYAALTPPLACYLQDGEPAAQRPRLGEGEDDSAETVRMA